MEELFVTNAEKHALAAEKLPAFRAFKLAHTKDVVRRILDLIGRDGFFGEYTRHDISHVDAMLQKLDWLIPAATQAVMTPTDWLMITLSIYFHDLGMAITRSEFEGRAGTEFPAFKMRAFAGPSGQDYAAKVGAMDPDTAERFLYQEFVRERHADRVKQWVSGRVATRLGAAEAIAAEISNALQGLHEVFRRDLGMVCESHHLEDLDNIRKYKVSQPYGNLPAETANLQYAALLLRSADLLHITSDRTPSVQFRLINPSDPISQTEWAKQMSIRSVRPKAKLADDGTILQSDTVEVHAFFADPNGFFALASYLAYAKTQLLNSHKCGRAGQSVGAAHSFPWKYIDDSTGIEAEGFLPQNYSFNLDQAKILNLLIGHTLYNDSSVVVRELIQNSLDAVRLRTFDEAEAGRTPMPGWIKVHWDARRRELSVHDNGTGMTLETIERHLLTVGASRYQDPSFKNSHPLFSPISRFGIGILSTFMIADEVEILTSVAEEQEARVLSLKSVHGKYLIRLLRKDTDRDATAVSPYGTRVALKLRASAQMEDVLETVRRWVVVPGCEVSVGVDELPPVQVGFSTIGAALTDVLARRGIAVVASDVNPAPESIVIREVVRDGVALAYALKWSEHYREWSFVALQRNRTYPGDEDDAPALGTCVEGIRVESETPGFREATLFAMANTTGPRAPKTNVARSGLEATEELDRVLQTIYDLYCEHVAREGEELRRRAFSLSWAATEAQYLMSPLVNARNRAVRSHLLTNAMKRVPQIVAEQDGKRVALAPHDLREDVPCWTIESTLVDSAETLIREVAGDVSLGAVVEAVRSDVRLPDGTIVSGMNRSDSAFELALGGRQVEFFRIVREQRRIDLRWGVPPATPRWREVERLVAQSELLQHSIRRSVATSATRLVIGREPVPVEGGKGEVAIRSGFGTFILAGTPVAALMNELFDRASAPGQAEAAETFVAACAAVGMKIDNPRAAFDVEMVRNVMREGGRVRRGHEEYVEQVAALLEPPWPVYSLAWWARGKEDDWS
jgi:molecular chaperone HtpG